MESRMPSLLKRTRARLVLALLTLLVALGAAGAANAEFPYMNTSPSVKGTPQEGQTLNGLTGLWLYTSGLKCETNECTYTYTWQRCNADSSGCVDIPGATGFTYLLTAADVGKRIRFVEWVFKRDCGEVNRSDGSQECRDITKNGVSALTPVVEPKPVTIAQATAPPTIQGVAMEDEVLRASGGTWTSPTELTKAFYWQRCNAVGEACETVVGAVGPTYRIRRTDVGGRIRVIETAANAGGTAQAVSAVTAVVSELKPTAARPTIAASRVALPHRLIADAILVRQRGRVVTLRVKISDDRGFRVTGVLVGVTPTGLLAGSGRARATDATGWATFTFRATRAGTTFVFVQAHKRGEKPQTGVSTAHLFKVRVR